MFASWFYLYKLNCNWINLCLGCELRNSITSSNPRSSQGLGLSQSLAWSACVCFGVVVLWMNGTCGALSPSCVICLFFIIASRVKSDAMNHMQFIHSEVSNYLLSETAGSLNLCKFTSSAPLQFHWSPMQRCEIRMASLRIKGVLDAGMSFYQASAFIYHF